jgi:hypothetical protein
MSHGIGCGQRGRLTTGPLRNEADTALLMNPLVGESLRRGGKPAASLRETAKNSIYAIQEQHPAGEPERRGRLASDAEE